MNILIDIKANRRNTKALFLVIFLRVSSFFSKVLILRVIGFPIRVLYKLIVQWVLGCDINDRTKIEPGLQIYHGQGLIVNEDTIIGKNVILRQNTTIGLARPLGKSPVIMDNVDIGANSAIIGDIVIGNNSIIGAGSVVVKDVKPYSIVGGNPAKLIRMLFSEEEIKQRESNILL